MIPWILFLFNSFLNIYTGQLQFTKMFWGESFCPIKILQNCAPSTFSIIGGGGTAAVFGPIIYWDSYKISVNYWIVFIIISFNFNYYYLDVVRSLPPHHTSRRASSCTHHNHNMIMIMRKSMHIWVYFPRYDKRPPHPMCTAERVSMHISSCTCTAEYVQYDTSAQKERESITSACLSVNHSSREQQVWVYSK